MMTRRTTVAACVMALLTCGTVSTAQSIIVDSFFDVYFMPESVYELEGPITFPPAPDGSGGVVETEMISMTVSGPKNPEGSVALPPPSGSFIVDSFFDVEYRLSLDGLPPGEPLIREIPIPPEIRNPPGSPTGHYETEMLAMDLSAVGPSTPPHLIRLSSTQPSLGEHIVTDLGNGNFSVDSFFDVHYEISFDNGSSWVAANNAGRISIVSAAGLIPEPSALLLALFGAAGIAARRR